ncbi:MAG: DUF3971 domain-containing protein [Gammaproteobacteria bacterium]|nr:DUF3971 domain-containing protein [Gammaproteobacteria bacterium]
MADRDLISAPRKTAYFALVALAAVAALLAVLTLAARWFLASVDDYRDEFAAAASEALGVEVRVDSLTALLRGGDLGVLASGLVLGPVSVQSAAVELDALRSLLRMRAEISGVYAAGVELDIATDGLRRPAGGSSAAVPGLSPALLLAFPHLQIEDVTLNWRDTAAGKTRRFDNARIVLQRPAGSAGGLRVLVEADLPPALGRRLRFVGNLRDAGAPQDVEFQMELDGVEMGGNCELVTGERCWEGRVSGELRGRADGAGVQVALTDAVLQPGAAPSPEAAFPLSGGVQFSRGATEHLSFLVTFADLPLGRIADWLPEGKLPAALDAWLRRAPVAGRVTQAQVLYAGAPSDFSFLDGARVTAAIADAELNYRRGHPPLRGVEANLLFENGALRADISRLRVLDTRSEDTVVTIADVRRPLLSVTADGRGPLADVLSHLHHLKLFDAYGLTTAHLAASGDSRLRLNLEVPLSRKVKRKTVVSGTLDFEDSGLAFPVLGLDFDKLRGRLAFNRAGGSADNMNAELRGRAVTIAARRVAGGTALDLRATLAPYPDFADLMAAAAPPALKDFVGGEAQWRAEVLVPNLGAAAAAGGGFKVRLTSDLRGIRVNLPAPLGRDGEQAATFVLETGLGAAPRRVIYGDVFDWALPPPGGARSELRLGPGPHKAASGASSVVHGAIGQLDFGEWLAWWRAHGDRFDGGEAPPVPGAVDVVVRQAAFGGQALGELALKTARLPDGRLELRVDSEPVKGGVTFPKAQADNPRVYLDFKRLGLSDAMFAGIGGGESGAGDAPDPAGLPPLAIRADEFQLDEIAVNDLRVMTNPAESGLEISRASFSKLADGAVVGEVRLSGRWSGGERQRSTLKLEAESGDYGKLLRLWGFRTSLKGAQGTVRGDVAWNDSLLRFSLGKLEGEVVIDTQDGTVETVKPGVGKLLGLLNISEIAQRFTLDFKDVFDKGFAFDTMSGRLVFGGGDMTTENFIIDGPALNLAISGRTGIAARDYDQRIDVVPNLSSTLPLMSALFAGPLAGAIVFVVDKAARLGRRVDQVVTLRYALKGSWENPQVKFIGAPKARLKSGG